MVASASAAIMDSFFMARSPSCFSWPTKWAPSGDRSNG
jgi:hypothetical protein